MGKARSLCAAIDIGSTFTKGTLVDVDEGRLVARAQVPTTATHDVRIGVEGCLSSLSAAVAGERPNTVFASSSAQGGLCIVAIGLVPGLTLQAAQEVALGAGAKVVRRFGYRLTQSDVRDIGELAPDIILLCGGIDGGDEKTLVGNAQALAKGLAPVGTVIVAGNRVVVDQCAELLEEAGWDARVAANVLPEIDVLVPEPARALIREVFLDKITEAKGISLAQEQLDGPIMPTPAAVLASVELLTGRRGIVGPVTSAVLVDVGGATTDVVSVLDDSRSDQDAVQVGLPPPTVKRTVEGDLGMRHNARTIVERFDLAHLLEGESLSSERAQELLDEYRTRPELLASGVSAEAFDAVLLRTAIREASLRHCGTIEEVRAPYRRPTFRVRGKDLRPVELLIGTGGILSHREDGWHFLEHACSSDDVPESLRPESPRLAIDGQYVMYACGILADRHPEAALSVANASLGLSGVHAG